MKDGETERHANATQYVSCCSANARHRCQRRGLECIMQARGRGRPKRNGAMPASAVHPHGCHRTPESLTTMSPSALCSRSCGRLGTGGGSGLGSGNSARRHSLGREWGEQRRVGQDGSAGRAHLRHGPASPGPRPAASRVQRLCPQPRTPAGAGPDQPRQGRVLRVSSARAHNLSAFTNPLVSL